MTPPPELRYQTQTVPEVMVCLLAADGAGDFFSPSWRAFSGLDATQSAGFGWFGAIHPDHRSLLATDIETAVATREGLRRRLRLRRRDGEYVWHRCEGIVRFAPDGNFLGLIGVMTDITREIRDAAEADLAGRHFVDLLPHAETVALALDNAGRTLYFNRALTELLGAPATELAKSGLLGRFLDRQHRPLDALLFPGGRPATNSPTHVESEFIAGRDGRHIFSWHTIPLRDYAGEPSGLILLGDDLTEKRHAEEQLRLTSRVFEATDLAMILTDSRGTILSANAAFSRLTGYSTDEAVGNNPRILQSGRHDAAFYRTMWQTILAEGHWQGEIWDRRKDGSVYPKFLSINALRNESNEVTHYSGVFYDISDRKAVEERLDRLAHFDALTELPNRLFLLDRLAMACHFAAANQQRFALLFLDLDRFKQINDTLGHHAGDELLRATGRRLREAIRSHDIAARIGGDEFTVLLGDIKEAENAARVAQKIVAAFAQPVVIDETAIPVTTSIGIALCPDDACDPDSLLRLADQAMYRAKAAGRNQYRFHKAVDDE